MSVQKFPLTAGRVTPLTASMTAGSTIINNDSLAAVWISTAPGVAPGLGVRLGPKGSLEWTAPGAPAYACLDTGVTSAAALTVTTEMGGIDNPVDVGVSVALQLRELGVPAVFVSDQLVYKAGSIPGMINVADYSSVSYTANFTSPGRLIASIYDATGYAALAQYVLNISDTGYASFNIPVYGSKLSITFSGASSDHCLFGTNIPLAQFTVNNQTPNVQFTANQEWFAGLGMILGTVTTNGGPHRFYAYVSGPATNKGYFRLRDYSGTGALTLNQLISTTGMQANPLGTGFELFGSMILPPGVHSIDFYPYAAGTYTVALSLQHAL